MPRPLLRGTLRAHEALVQLRNRVVVNNLHSFATESLEYIGEAIDKLRNLLADASSLHEQVENIFGNTKPTLVQLDALEDVVNLYAETHTASKDVKGSLKETFSHLLKMSTLLESLDWATENLHDNVRSSPSIPHVSQNDWKATRRLNALIRASQRNRPHPSSHVVKPSQQRLHMEQTGRATHPSMEMKPKRMKLHVEKLRRKLLGANLSTTIRDRMGNELSALEGLLINQEHDRRTPNMR